MMEIFRANGEHIHSNIGKNNKSMTIYTSAFNLINNQFDYLPSIDNFCKFAENVVVAVNTSKDDTLKQLLLINKAYANLTIVESDFSYDDPLLDGKIKNFALQTAETITNDEIFIGLDLDEKLPIWQHSIWENLGKYLIPEFDSIMIPSINLWGDVGRVRWDTEKNRAYKWYMHRRGLARGPYFKGVKESGHLNVEVSDGTELVDIEGNLTNSARIDKHLDHITDGEEYFMELLRNNLPYVIHEGYLSFEERIQRNAKFWSEQWKKCSNSDVKVETKVEELSSYPTIPHGLTL